MAKVRNPLLSLEASGTIGGITFSTYRGIACARVKAQPVRRFNGQQPYNRSIIGYLSRQWGGLTDISREAWKAWSRGHPQSDGMGGKFQQAGINAYVQLNAVRMMIDSTAVEVDDPPVSDLNIGMKSLTAVSGAVSGEINLVWTLNGTGVATDFIDIQLAGPFASRGVFEVGVAYKRVKAEDGDHVAVTIDDLQAGAFYWVRVRYVKADGQVSSFLQSQAVAKV